MADSTPATVSIVSRYNECVPNKPCELGLLFQLKPGWHIYWKNPGDSGAAPKFSYISPPNLNKVEFKWPIPKKIPVQHLVNFGYEEEVLLPFEVTPIREDKSLDILVKGEWLVCKEDCIPFDGEFKFSQPIQQQTSLTKYSRLFEDNRFPIPNLSLPKEEQMIVHHSGTTLELLFPNVITGKDFSFFAGEKHIAESSYVPSVLFENGHTRVQITTKALTAKDLLVENLIHDGVNTYSFNIANTNQVPTQILETPDSNFTSILSLLFLAFIGGLILNLMPCVLPILAIKAVQLVNSKSSSLTDRIVDATSYTVGVITSMLTLFTFVVIAKASGEFLGWGFQFQNPWFAGICGVFFFILGLNLLELFEFSNFFPQKLLQLNGTSRIAKGFFSGVGTTIISTPCTAPFAGASIAFALSASIGIGMIIFCGLAIGLAAPFACTFLWPKLIRSIIPKPGEWMRTFKRLCAVPMFLTSLWLGWVVYIQIMSRASSLDDVYIDSWNQQWEPYSINLINQIQQNGDTAFVDFTAAWCITCQVNKSVIFRNEDVRNFIAKNKVILVRADWTNKDVLISMALKSFNRASVPLNVIYKKNAPPIILPTLLTGSTVLEALKLDSNVP